MKKLLLLSLFVFSLFGCKIGNLDIKFPVLGIVSPTAMQDFIATGGNTVRFTDIESQNQTMNIAVNGTMVISGITYPTKDLPVSCGNNIQFVLQSLDPANGAFWANVKMEIVYDPGKYKCGETYICDRPGDAQGNYYDYNTSMGITQVGNLTYDGNVALEQGFGAHVNVVCDQCPKDAQGKSQCPLSVVR